MFRSTDSWVDQFDRRPVLTIFKAALWLVLLVVFVTALVWGIASGWSYWWGRGEGVQQKNDVQNWTSAQRAFHQEFNDVQADGRKIIDARTALATFEQAHPNLGNGTPFDPLAQQDTNLRTTLTGLQQQCENTVAGYNTDAQSYLTADWRDADLPEQLDDEACR